jgi:hypothetical protein
MSFGYRELTTITTSMGNLTFYLWVYNYKKTFKFNFKFIEDDMNFDLFDDISLEIIKH